MNLSWVFPLNIWLRLRELQAENDLLRAQNAELQRQALKHALEMSSLTQMYTTSMLSMQQDIVKRYRDAISAKAPQ